MSNSNFKVANHKRTYVIAEQKGKKIILTAIKVMSNGKDFKSNYTLTPSIIKDLKSAKSYREFRTDKISKKHRIPEALLIDSKARKAGLTKNTQYDGNADAIARILNIRFRVVESRLKLQKARKVKVKK